MFRSYIKTKVFYDLKKKYKCYFLFDKSIDLKKPSIGTKEFLSFGYPDQEKNKYQNY